MVHRLRKRHSDTFKCVTTQRALQKINQRTDTIPPMQALRRAHVRRPSLAARHAARPARPPAPRTTKREAAYSLKLDHSPFTFLALVLCVACSKNE